MKKINLAEYFANISFIAGSSRNTLKAILIYCNNF